MSDLIVSFAQATDGSRSNLALSYFWALVLTCIAFSSHLLMGFRFAGFAFLTFFPAVVLASFLCGSGPAYFTTMMGAVLAGLIISYQSALVPLTQTGLIVAFAVYFATNVLIIALVDALLVSIKREEDRLRR